MLCFRCNQTIRIGMSKHEEFNKLYQYLDYTLHELPAGVLYDANGASESHCVELMKATYQLEELANQLDEDIGSFLTFCSWHYERYPHYLSRQRLFVTYNHYMEKYGGLLKHET